MKKFIFTGRGSAFLTSEGNTSCYLKDKKNFLLIDCGETVFSKLKEYDLLDKSYENFIICLTHLHPDHAGSLGSLIFYMYYIQKVKTLIIYPDKENLFSYFDLIGADRKISYPKNIENAVEVTIPDIQSYDRVQQAIIPLIQRYGDNTPNGSKTYRAVYKKMGKSNKAWKNMQTRYHCKSKKELLLKYDKYYAEFVQAINNLISDGEVTPNES